MTWVAGISYAAACLLTLRELSKPQPAQREGRIMVGVSSIVVLAVMFGCMVEAS